MARRIDEIMESVVSIEDTSHDGTNWLQESLKTSANPRKGYNKFFCCFITVQEELSESDKSTTTTKAKQFQCYPKAKQKVVNSKVQDALKCVSDLIYEIILDNN